MGKKDRRPRRDGPSPIREEPVREFFEPTLDILFYPEEAPFESLTKAIRTSGKTFQLFDIARTILEKPARFAAFIKCRKEGKGARNLFVCPVDGLVFESPDATLGHVLSQHLDRFFKVEVREVDPPKGQYPSIAVCGLSKKVLAPPNYHRYQSILREHHAEHFPHMSYERFLEKVEITRDEDKVQEWMEGMRKRTFYLPLSTGESAPPAPAPESLTPATTPPPSSGEATSTESESISPQDDAPVTPSVDSGISDDAVTDAAGASEPEPAPPAPEAEKPAPEPLEGLDAARAFLLQHRKKDILREVEAHRLTGTDIEKLPQGLIRQNIEFALEQQRKFPLDTVNHLRGRFRRIHFNHFKWGPDGFAYVSAIKRRPIGPDTVFADSIQHLIQFIESNPNLRISAICREFLGVTLPRPAQDGASPPALEPEAEKMVRGLLRDLRWLTLEGYIIEFADGSFHLATMRQTRSEKPLPADPISKPPPEPGEEKEPVVNAPEEETGDPESSVAEENTGD